MFVLVFSSLPFEAAPRSSVDYLILEAARDDCRLLPRTLPTLVV